VPRFCPSPEDTDLEAQVLSGSKRFWQIIDSAYRRAEKEGWTDLDDLD
jgi:hypothetical protein